MKRIAALLSIFIFVISFNVSFADTFTVEKVSPKDGEKNILAANFLMKITFSEDVIPEGNEGYFKLTDKKGNPVAMKVIQGTSPDRIDIKAEKSLESDQEYQLEIDPLLKAVSGNTLAEKHTSTFTTSKMKTDLGFKGIVIMFAVLAISGFILQITRKKVNKMKEERKEQEMKEKKRLERLEKKEKQRQKYENQEKK